MANRRMFSRTVTGTGRFLRMSAEARALYYDLGMEADDDGFVEAYVRVRATGSDEEHLNELERRGFITILDREDLVVHITDWEANNQIRKDRYAPSVYRALYPQCVGQEPAEVQPQPEPMGEPEPIQQQEESIALQEEPIENSTETTEDQLATTGKPDGCFLGDSLATQVRLGKDRIVKDSLVKDRIGKHRSTKDARAYARESGQSALENPGEKQIEFIKKKRESLDYLMNSEYFSQTRASPEIMPPV